MQAKSCGLISLTHPHSWLKEDQCENSEVKNIKVLENELVVSVPMALERAAQQSILYLVWVNGSVTQQSENILSSSFFSCWPLHLNCGVKTELLIFLWSLLQCLRTFYKNSNSGEIPALI